MPTKPPTWTHLKQALSDYEKPELLRLLQELYNLNADNKLFLASRLIETDLEALAEPYRKAIQAEFNPRSGFPRLNLRAARKAINDFKKACHDPTAIADLMIFYVEQGVICTNTYGDISEGFYNSLESVYAEALKVITSTGDPGVIETFRPRLRQIVRNTSSIGWGFHDEVSRLSEEEYPSEV
jgi:hypothetical protein